MAIPKTKKTVKSKKTASAKPKKSTSTKLKKNAAIKSEATVPKLEAVPETKIPKIEDPIGDETDGEGETANEAGAESESKTETEAAAAPEFTPASRPPAKLERLQKILAAAGVASRRSAEAMIEQGRVEVNGKVVTVLGSKADAARDHIRVDGKLLQGPERHRYFVLNKPRGYVTTVKDPEHRPTVMQFFDKMKERLYPVGRLDYLSEGLLIVTNDGELANRLTKASSGVEKTYLVKVSGQPTEAELNILRGGVAIERGRPGSPPVRTSPARIRQVRQGDNPWYEVVLIEGRNRELRKMFEEIGHFVEKIRRVGYGPLVLDQEPGNLRELQPAELAALRKAADGTLRTPKSKELRRRNLLDAGLLPTVLPKPSSRPAWKKDSRPADSFANGAANKLFRPARPSGFPPKKFGAYRAPHPAGSFDKGAGKPFRSTRATGEGFRSTDRPVWKKDDRPTRPPTRFAAGSTGESRPGPGRPFTAKPAWKKPERPARTAYQRPSAPRREAPAREIRVFDEDLGPVRPPNLHIEEISGPDRSSSPRASSYRSSAPRPYSDRPRPSRSSFERPTSSSRPAAKSVRGESGQSRPYTTSSGKPRAGGARPSSKSGPGWKPKSRFGPGKPASGSFRPFTPRTEGTSDFRPTKAKQYPNSASRAERKAGPGWKPKSSFNGPGKPVGGARFKPKSSGFSKSAYKPKPGGFKRSGPRPFGNRPDGKKRG